MSPFGKSAKVQSLWAQSLNWLRETGWPTCVADAAIADAVYREWIDATQSEWTATGYRDRERLSDAIDMAFRAVRDERTADALVILYLFLFELRGRREGTLQRHRNH